MGSMCGKPVLSTIVERRCLPKSFRVGVAEMNGWRGKMEDAHVIHMRDDWGFFGVYDGHGGDQCSAFVAAELHKRLDENGCPKDDADVRTMAFSIDDAWMAQEDSDGSGTTGAMCIVHRPAEPGAKLRLRVANIGDSRVLLGRRDGTIVDGGFPCTDKGLTRDHKPDDEVETERIVRCGGTVEKKAGAPCARVNGDLAVSRAFGDAKYKTTGGPGPEDRPVTVDPEFGHFECDEADFLVIVCDGVSEGDFPNPAVISFIVDQLKQNGDDLGAAAREVCFKAEACNSKDNITCMIVMFDGLDSPDGQEFTPGPISDSQSPFLKAYEAMAERANLTRAEAIEMRYEKLSADLAAIREDEAEPSEELKAEETRIGEPPGTKGSDERTAWFKDWKPTEDPSREQRSGPGFNMESLLSGGMGNPQAMDILRALTAQAAGGRQADNQESQSAVRLCAGEIRKVRCVADVEELRAAVESNDNHELKWDDKLKEIAGCEGFVKQDDQSDGTTQVRFPGPGFIAWLPTSVLTDIPGDSPATDQPPVTSGGYEERSPPET